MLEGLRNMEGAPGMEVRVVNIDTDSLLRQHYGMRIPVLVAADDGRVLSENRLDTETVQKYLAGKSRRRD